MTPREFSAHYEICIPYLRAYARSLSRNADMADDLVQDAFMRAWAARHQYADGTNFKAWMFTILRNRFFDVRRHNRTSETPIEDIVDTMLVTQPPQDTVVYFDDMARAFWRLSPNHREVLILVGALELEYEAAARVMGCAVGTVRSRLSRARFALQGMLNRDSAEERVYRHRSDSGAAEFLQLLAAA